MEYVDTKKKYKIRRAGDIYLEIEELINELIDDHDMQRPEIVGGIDKMIEYHRPDAEPEEI